MTLTQAKKKTWVSFSKYIRLRDCRGESGGNCYTCLRWYPIGQLQAGHFIPGRRNAYLFSEEQVHAQCYSCNVGKKGNWPPYLERMRKEIGDEAVDLMLYSRHDTRKYTVPELMELKEHYDQKIKELGS